MSALLTLAVFSAASGVLILCVFKAASNQRALRTAQRRLRAHLLAMRLFGDDPLEILRSQGRLLLWTGRYMVLLLPPFLLVAIPLFFAWDHLDAVWGHAALAPGETAMVTTRVRGEAADAQLTVPGWLAVETPAVHVLAEHEVSWRVRILQAGSGELSVVAGHQRATRLIEARPGMHYLRERTGGGGGVVEWIEVRYPPTDPEMLGVSANWAVWFCVISTFTALVLRRRLRVAF